MDIFNACILQIQYKINVLFLDYDSCLVASKVSVNELFFYLIECKVQNYNSPPRHWGLQACAKSCGRLWMNLNKIEIGRWEKENHNLWSLAFKWQRESAGNVDFVEDRVKIEWHRDAIESIKQRKIRIGDFI